VLGYLAKRLIWGLLTLFGVTVVAFLIVYRLPARPEVVLAGPRADPATVAAIRQRLKLDQPLPVQ
jgi:ABC-type dipeptide/oligopeptide/nickel transport system permease component